MNDNEEDRLALARDRGARMLEGMDDRDRTAFIARALINAAFQASDIPELLRADLYAVADRLAEDPLLDPDAVAIEAFRRHGYAAGVKDVGDGSIFHAVKIVD